MPRTQRRTMILGVAAVFAVSVAMLLGISQVPRGHPHGLPGLLALMGLALFLPAAIVATVSAVALVFRIAETPTEQRFVPGLVSRLFWLGLGGAVAVLGLTAYAMDFLPEPINRTNRPILRLGVAMLAIGGLAGLAAAIQVARGRLGRRATARPSAIFCLSGVVVVLAVEIMVLGALFFGLSLL